MAENAKPLPSNFAHQQHASCSNVTPELDANTQATKVLKEGRMSPVHSQLMRHQDSGDKKLQESMSSALAQNTAERSTEQLLLQMTPKQSHDLCAKRDKVEAHIQSLKNRNTVLTSSAEHQKEQISGHYERMRKILNSDEKATLELIDVEKRVALGKLQKIIKEWTSNLDQINKSIKATQKVIDQEESQMQDQAQEDSKLLSSQATVIKFTEYGIFTSYPRHRIST
ncbi:uncharacterized protein LOC144682935 isoform X2 [Cetorhinus maximus]